MKLTNKKTYPIIKEILARREFKQLEISRSTKVSFGRVNKVVNWLVEMGYVTKGKGAYVLRGVVAVVNVFPFDRQVKKLLIGELSIDIEKEQLNELIKKHKGVLCLTSALQQYDSYYRDPAVRVYGNAQLLKELENFDKGNIKVEIYRDDINREEDVRSIRRIRTTDEIRTVIDLYCSPFAYASDRLIRKLWLK